MPQTYVCPTNAHEQRMRVDDIGAIHSWLICEVYVLLISLVVIVHCGYRKAIPTGMMAGAMAQFLASPTDLVKVRLQMEGKRVLQGLEPR